MGSWTVMMSTSVFMSTSGFSYYCEQFIVMPSTYRHSLRPSVRVKWKSRLFSCHPKLPKHDSGEGAVAVPQGLQMGFWDDHLCALHIIWFPGTNFDKSSRKLWDPTRLYSPLLFFRHEGNFWGKAGLSPIRGTQKGRIESQNIPIFTL